MDKLQVVEQFRAALQMFAQSLSNEKAMEIATLYPKFKIGVVYKKDIIFSYGVNEVGDPQLYRVNQEHTSAEQWIPGTEGTASLYTPIGINANGHPIWSQPTGAHDAYNIGDIVDYKGTLYKSKINGNTYCPETQPDVWEVYTE